MAIAAVQERAKVQVSGGTSASDTFVSSVTSGNLVTLTCFTYQNAGGTLAAGDVTKTAGTSTIGTITLDKSFETTVGPAQAVGVWSVPVTGTGTLTLQLGSQPAGSFFSFCIGEYSGTDITASRVETTNGAEGLTTTPGSGNVTTAGAALLLGSLATDGGGATAITEDTPWVLLGEEENGLAQERGSIIRQIVTTGTTDQAGWTIPSAENWGACVVAYKAAGGAGGADRGLSNRFYQRTTYGAGGLPAL